MTHTGMRKYICKIFLAFLLTAVSITAFGQARLGSTDADIKAEYGQSRYKLKAGYNSSGSYYVSINTGIASVLYFFNEKQVCTSVCIVPNNQGVLNYYVELYNKQYVIVSSKKWKMYSDDGIANIELIYPDKGGYYFLWSTD